MFTGLDHRGDREDERDRLTDKSLELRYDRSAIAVPGGYIEQVEEHGAVQEDDTGNRSRDSE